MSGVSIISDRCNGEPVKEPTEWTDKDEDFSTILPHDTAHMDCKLPASIAEAGKRDKHPIRTFVLNPSLIYGIGAGMQRTTFWARDWIERAKEAGHSGTFGEGANALSHIHMHDVATALLVVLRAALTGKAQGWKACNYFVGVSWTEQRAWAKVVGDCLYSKGIVNEAGCRPWPEAVTGPKDSTYRRATRLSVLPPRRIAMASTFTRGEHLSQPYQIVSTHPPSASQLSASSEDHPLASQPRSLSFPPAHNDHHGPNEFEDAYFEPAQQPHVISPDVKDISAVGYDVTYLPWDDHCPNGLDPFNPTLDSAYALALFDTQIRHGFLGPNEMNRFNQDITRILSFGSGATSESVISGTSFSGTGVHPSVEHLTDARFFEPSQPSASCTDPCDGVYSHQEAPITGFEGGIQSMNSIAHRNYPAEFLAPPAPLSQACFEPQDGPDFPLFEHGDTVEPSPQTPANNREIELVERHYEPNVNVVNNQNGESMLQRLTPPHAKRQSKKDSPPKKRTATARGKGAVICAKQSMRSAMKKAVIHTANKETKVRASPSPEKAFCSTILPPTYLLLPEIPARQRVIEQNRVLLTNARKEATSILRRRLGFTDDEVLEPEAFNQGKRRQMRYDTCVYIQIVLCCSDHNLLLREEICDAMKKIWCFRDRPCLADGDWMASAVFIPSSG
ncbi:hypothetical protein CONPUDRAFT_150700 [Coniophora puteana RWD-64-598 SS2]|uniref:NAD-dependent epimerase/dehydratase domain-containing protein n=1 Tax=Coniophora puteana (strain RWD-64-598) TaxID=741705 RepID=A0A5M3MY22_CONPW|nr:uncharacterized protein CONPUDRAFT_150700 [Coniophora puteana RWD-64-598 SS2]EIW83625.1 hypothetical protein CONPUDRAFT_150700 [Coniophora puteana RWD-64-598 SS2]